MCCVAGASGAGKPPMTDAEELAAALNPGQSAAQRRQEERDRAKATRAQKRREMRSKMAESMGTAKPTRKQLRRRGGAGTGTTSDAAGDEGADGAVGGDGSGGVDGSLTSPSALVVDGKRRNDGNKSVMFGAVVTSLLDSQGGDGEAKADSEGNAASNTEGYIPGAWPRVCLD